VDKRGLFSERKRRLSLVSRVFPSVLVACLVAALLPASPASAEVTLGHTFACSTTYATVATAEVLSPNQCAQAPQNVAAHPIDNGVLVSWDALADNALPPLAYVVSIESAGINVTVDPERTSTEISGLTNGVSYSVSMTATNEIGASEIAGPVEVIPTNGFDGAVSRLIVQYESGVAANQSPGVATGTDSAAGIELIPESDLGEGLRTVRLTEPVTTEASERIIETLEADPRVKWAEAEEVVTLTENADADTDYFSKQWNLWSSNGVAGERTFSPTFGRSAEDLGQGSTVAVIDTGVTRHSDFGARMLGGFDFVSNHPELSSVRAPGGTEVAFDGDYVDTESFGQVGWDNNPSDSGDWRGVDPIRNSSWHGTHVAGIIGAQVNNSRGIAGLVPLANIVPIRAISWRGGLSSDIAASIIWASGGRVAGVEDNPNPADVINLSFTTKSACSATFQAAIDIAIANGSLVAVAAGNANSNVSEYSPANCNGVIAVGATDASGQRAQYSNFGSGIDIAAPGGDINASGDRGIYSLSNKGEQGPSDEGYAYRQGTSMAVAHVSAALARLAALNPTANPTELQSLLTMSSVRPFAQTTCDVDTEKTCGAGIVQIAANPLNPGQLTATAGVNSVALKWPTSAATSVTGVRIKWGTNQNSLSNEFTIAGRTTDSFIHMGSPVRVTNRALTSNVATLTTATPHGLLVGDSIAVSEIDATFNGRYTVRSVTATTFTYARTASNVGSAALAAAGNVQRADSLSTGQTYYYQVAYVYTDNAQACATACLTDYSAVVSDLTQFARSTVFSPTGAPQPYVVPAGITGLNVSATGGSGGATTSFAAGRGGRVEAILPVTPGEVLFFFVGGMNNGATGGWNGGASGTAPGEGGGGASDIRRGIAITEASLTSNVARLTSAAAHGLAVGNSIVVAGIGSPFDGTYSITSIPSTTTLTYARTNANVASATVTGAVIQTLPASSWARRVLVAGGGGGAGSHAAGGSGGGLIASAGVAYGGNAGGDAGTQSTGNALGAGAGGTTNAGGGGGGYWGGGGGAAYAGGGGGSSFTGTGAYGISHTSAASTGAGSIRVRIPQTTTMVAPTQFTGKGWSRSTELTWTVPPLDDVTGYRIRWGLDPTQIVNQFDVSGGDTNFFTHSATPVSIVSKAKTATVATLTTSVDHRLAVGQEVAVSGVDATFNGIVRVATVPTSKSFTYALAGTSVAESVVRPTGLVQRTSQLPVGQTYYYRIASIYTDIAQPCGSSCLSAYSSPITVDGRFGVTTSFPFTGSTATYTVPAGVGKIQVDVQGAQGGSSTAPVVGGKGGRVRATLPVTPGETLFLNVGGGGGTHFPFFFKDDVTAGFNGGGTGTGNGSGGGGASDIRRGITVTNAVLNNNVVTLTTSTAHGLAVSTSILVAGVSSVFNGTYTIAASPTPTTLTYAKTYANIASAAVNGALIQSNLVISVARRVVVAGGGGGFGHARNPGGAGGGLIGAEGTSNDTSNVSGLGGTQTSGSALGVGGNGSTNAGGGGGGYWGGYGSGQGGQPDGRSTSGYSGGGGGSSWTASDIVFVDHTQGFRSGNGLISITTAQESLIPSPSNVTATGWNRRVHLAWTASNNQEATGYRIKWGTSSGALTNVINVAGGSTSEYVHSDLAMGTRFFYSIATRYTDLNQDCGTECLSDFSSEISEITRFTATSTFEFTESIQSYTVPAGVSKINVYAAAGQGGSNAGQGGGGGAVTATMPVTPGETLFVFVGGGGGDNHPDGYRVSTVAGWNGGGTGTGTAGGGGGASDIRRGISVSNAVLTSRVATLTTSTAHGFIAGHSVVVAGVGAAYDGTYTVLASPAPTATTFSYTKTELNIATAVVSGAVIRNLTSHGLENRAIVAGGGGGAGYSSYAGGNGGGLVGAEGVSHQCSGGVSGYCSGLGGGQTYGNALGIGGSASTTNSGAGGGGYYGGYAAGRSPQQYRTGADGYSAGGGGSSWTADDVSFVTHTQNARAGNGIIYIYAPEGGSLSAPADFDAYGYQSHTILNWKPSAQAAVTGYRISWGTSQGVLSNTIDIPGRLTQSFVHHGNTFAVVNSSLATNAATLTTSTSHGINPGEEFIVQGVGSPFDGTYVAASGTTATTLKYALVSGNVAARVVSPSGVVSRTKQLTINTTYYYEIASLYTDAARTCNDKCESASSSQRYATPIFTQNISFEPTNQVQTYTVPAGVSWVQFDALGGVGARGTSGTGGSGGRVQGAIPVTPGEVLYLYVGGRGGGSLDSTLNVGGWNGGGNGNAAGQGGGGGGATDIRRNKMVVTNKIIQNRVATLTTAETHGFSVGHTVIVSGVDNLLDGTFVVTTVPNDKTFTYAVTTSTMAGVASSGTVSGPSLFSNVPSLATRIVVAGGGGGGGYNSTSVGGAGGGLLAREGVSHDCGASYCSGYGGSQTYGNKLGVGGSASSSYAGGGGGGYWGGWASGQSPQLNRTQTGGYSGGGGGSSFASPTPLSSSDARTIAGVTHTQGMNRGEGSLVLSVPTRAYPSGVEATGWSGYNSISWDPSEISGVTQYKVYGGTTQNPSTVIATLPVGVHSFDHHGTTFEVTTKALSANTAVLTTRTAHGLSVGNQVVVSGVDDALDGIRTITAVTATTLRFAVTAANIASQSVLQGVVQSRNGLTLGTSYFYRVTVVAQAVESEKSTEVTATPSFSSSQNFAATKSVQTFTVPVNVTKIFITADGAMGGTGTNGPGGRGGRTQGAISVTPGEVLYVYVGDAGGELLSSSNNVAGWNGGGNGNSSGQGGGGGGATDIRRNRFVVTNKIIQGRVATLNTAEQHGFSVGSTVIVSGVDNLLDGTFVVTAVPNVRSFSYAVTTLSMAGVESSGIVSGPSLFSNATSLASRLIVAGGGGGGGYSATSLGGIGGGLMAGEGVSHDCANSYCSGYGGSQTYGNALGVGGSASSSYAGAGGGGYWGGWASGQSPQLNRTPTGGYSGGGGGSSYASSEVTSVFFARGTQQGDGEMEISWAASPVVTGVQATPTNAAVSISWDESRLTSLTAYRVYGGTAANPTTLLATVPAGTLGYTHTGLTNGTTYYYRVAPIVTINGQTREAPLSGDVSAIPTSLTSVTITASGAVNAFTVPAGVSWLQFDAAGGQGAQGSSGVGGKGGRVQGAIPVTPGETLYRYVGGAANKNVAGWNGGGSGSAADQGGGGGGATDIRRNRFVVTNKIIQSRVATLNTAEQHGFSVGGTVIVSGVDNLLDGSYVVTAVPNVRSFSYAVTTLSMASAESSGFVTGPSLFSNATSLASRVVVAGGGGGGGLSAGTTGGAGGGLTAREGGSHDCASTYCSGYGGSQTYGNAIGTGGSGSTPYSGGGGGGYWGGWASGQNPQLNRTGSVGYSAGGGGSSYTSTEVAVPVHTQGHQSGAGYLTLSYSVDVTAPEVTGVSSPNPVGNYLAGREITVNVAFSEAVVVTGTPTLTLNAGTRDVDVAYVAGSGSSTLTFKYVVATGDLITPLDIKDSTSLQLAGGTISDRVGNSAVLTLPNAGTANSLAGSKTFAVDGVVPTSPTVLTAAGIDGITLDWEDNADTDLQSYRIYSCSGLIASSCANSASFSVLSSVSQATSTFDHIAVGRGISYYYYVTAVDTRGNESPASNVVSWILPVPVMVATPSIVSDSPTSDLTPEITGVADAGATVYIYVDGSSTPLGSATADSQGAYSFTPPNNLTAGEHSFRARATVAGVKTGSSGFSYEIPVVIDTTAPTFTSVLRQVPSSQTTGLDALTFRLSFSEVVSGLDNTDFVITGSTATVTRIAMVSGTIGAYDVTVSGGNLASLNGVLGLGFVATPTVTDIAGNSLAGIVPSITPQTYTLDNRNPVVSITSSAASLGGTGTAVITFTLDQVSTDFGVDDVATSGGTISNFAGSGVSYTATFSPSSGFAGSAQISVDAGSFRNASDVYNASSSLSISVDTTAPRVTNIQATTSNGIYRTGSVIDLSMTFDEAITVNTGGGVPSLLLETGATDRAATFVSSAGSQANFRYTVQAGDLSSDLDIQSADALAFNGGTIRDVVGNTANRSLMSPGATGSLAANAALVIDTVAPTAPTALALTPVGGTVVLNKLSATNTNLTATVSIIAGEATGGSAMLYLDGTLLATDTTITSTDSSATFTLGATTSAQLQALVAGSGILTVKLADLAGNLSAASSGVSLAVDYVVPTITVSSNKTSLIAGQTATITAVLSEPSINFVAGDITSVGGTIGAFSGSGSNYTFTFTPTANSTVAMSVSVAGGAFTDAVGNPNDVSNTVTATVDTAVPTVSSVSSSITNGAYKAGSVVDVSVVFTDAVTVQTGGGTPTLALNSAAGASATYVAGSGTNTLTFRYTVLASHTSSDLDYATVNSLALNLGTIRDSSGNDATVLLPTAGGASSLAGNKAIVIDTVAPTAPSGLVLTPVGGTAVSNTLLATTTNLTASATMTAGQATGGTANLLLGDTVLASDTSIGSSDTTLAFSLGLSSSSALQSAIAAGGAVTVRLIDAAGNISSSSASVTLVVDYVIPTITVTASSSSLRIGQTAVVTATLSEPSSTFTVSDFTISEGSLSGFTAVSSTVYRATFTPTSSRNQVTGSIAVLSAAFTDSAGNGNAASTSLSLAIDTAAPNVPVITGTSPIITNDVSPTIAGTAEAGSTVVVYDNSTSPATELKTLVATNGTWSFTDVALLDGDHSITAVATDVAGNASVVSQSVTWRIDSVPPVVTLSAIGGNNDITIAEKNAGIVVSGSVETNATLTLAFAGLTKSITPVSGAWSYTLTAGDWTAIGTTSLVIFVATATDAATNATEKSRAVAMNLSSVVEPGVPQLVPADDSGTQGDSRTNVRTVRLTTQLTNSGALVHRPGQLLQLVDLSGGVIASRVLTSADIAAGEYEFTVSSLDDGSYGYRAKVSSDGNSAASTSDLTLVIDNRVPGTPGAPDLESSSDTGVSSSDNVTKKTDPWFTIAIDGVQISGNPLIAGDKIKLRNGANVVHSSTLTSAEISAQSIRVQADAILAHGSHVISAQAESASGTSGSASQSITLVVDTTSPVAPAAPDLTGSSDSGLSDTDNVTNSVQPIFEVSLAGLGAVTNDSIALFDASNTMIGEVVIAQEDVLAGFVEVPLSGVFADGTHVVSARLSDRAGNSGTRSVGLTVTIDTEAPSASPPVLTAASDSGASSSDRITSVLRPTFSGAGIAGQRIDMYNGSGFLGSSTVSNAVWSYTALADLSNGPHQIRSKTLDLAGNESSFSSSVVVVIDTVRPADPTFDENIMFKNSSRPLLTGVAEIDALVTVRSGATTLATTRTAATGLWSIEVVDPLAQSVFALAATATDVAGNMNSGVSAASLTIDTTAPAAPTITAFNSVSSPLTLAGTGEAGATVSISDGSTIIGTAVVSGNGSWTFTTASLTQGAHSFTAVQTDAALNVSVASSPVRTISATQTAAVLGADANNNNNVALTASQYVADGITVINTPVKAGLMNDVIDELSAAAVDTQSELVSLAEVVNGILGTASGTAVSPPLTAASFALLGITGVTSENLAAVLAAIAATPADGSGVDSFSELRLLVDSAVAASASALTVISSFTGSNTAPTLSTYTNAAITGVSVANIGAVNSLIAELSSTATDTASEVQEAVNAYVAILNTADGVANGNEAITLTQLQTIGLGVMNTAAEGQLFNSVIDVASTSSVDTWTELDYLANVINRISTTVAGGTPAPPVTASDLALLGITGATSNNLTDILSAIAATPDNGSGVSSLSLLQSVVNTGIANAVANSRAIIANYIGLTGVPTLGDFANAGVTGVSSGNIASLNTFLAVIPESGSDSQSEVQATVDALAKVAAAANGFADNGATLNAADYASLGLASIDTAAEVALLNDVLDGKTASAVDTYVEVSILASIVSRIIGETTGTVSSPALTPQDFSALGIPGVTASNLDEVLAALRNSNANNNPVTDLSSLRTLVASAVLQARDAAILRISQFDGSQNSVEPTLADFANAEVAGVTANNLVSIRTAFAAIGSADSDSTTEIAAVVSGFIVVLAGADGTGNANVSLSAAQYQGFGITAIDTADKAALLNDVLDRKSLTSADEYLEIVVLSNIVSDVFLLATGGEPLSEVTAERLSLLGITGVTADNLSLVLAAITALNGNTNGLNSFADLQGIVNTVRANQESALAIIKNYDGTNTVPTTLTFAALGVSGVDYRNIALVNQYLASMSVAQTDSRAEVQALVDAVLKILVCADGIENHNCDLTGEEYRAMGYTDIDTNEEIEAMNAEMDVLDLSPADLHNVTAQLVIDITQRFTPVTPAPAPVAPTPAPVAPAPAPVAPTPVPAAPTTSTTLAPVRPVDSSVPSLSVTSTTVVSTTSTTTPTTTVPKILDGSGGVEVQPNAAVVLMNGATQDMQVSIAEGFVATAQIPGLFAVRLAPQFLATDPVIAGSNSEIRVFKGRTIQMSAEGFAAQSEVQVWVNSTPFQLGTITTDAAGSFDQTFDLPADIEVGNHVLTLSGTAKSGSAAKVSIGLIVSDISEITDPTNVPDDSSNKSDTSVNTDQEPFDARSEPKSTVALLGEMVALLALAGLAGSSSGGGGRKEDEDGDDGDGSDDRGSGEVADVSAGKTGDDLDAGSDVIRLPRLGFLDRFMTNFPQTISRRSPLVGTILADAAYLRSLLGAFWGLVPLLAVVTGLLAAANTQYEVVMPALSLLTVIVVVSVFDALFGYIAVLTFGVAVAIGGGIHSADSVRGLLGMYVFSFAVPLIATASRPFRRVISQGVTGLWDRTADLVLITLFGAWAGGSMFSALPGLIGFRPEYADRISHIQIAVALALVARFALENGAVILAPSQLREMTAKDLHAPTALQVVLSSFVRTALFVFVAEVFIGNNWALWAGAALYLVPKLIPLVQDSLPNVPSLHIFMPRGLLKIVLLLVIAKWWGGVLTSNISNADQMVRIGFVFMGAPGLVATICGWFGRSSTHKWKQNWITRIAGLVLLFLLFLMVQGIILNF
jgi:large repetitive protein